MDNYGDNIPSLLKKFYPLAVLFILISIIVYTYYQNQDELNNIGKKVVIADTIYVVTVITKYNFSGATLFSSVLKTDSTYTPPVKKSNLVVK